MSEPPPPQVEPGVASADQRGVWLTLVLLGLAFAGVTAWLQLDRLARFEPQSFDLAIYAQLVWNTGHGQAWSSVQQAPALAVHLTPLLLMLSPLTHLVDPAALLVVVQSLALGATAPLCYLVLRTYQRRHAAWFAGFSLLYPPLWSLALADFHPVTLGCPLSLLLAWSVASRRPRTALLLGLGLGIGVHEVYPLVLIGLGAALWLGGRRREAAVAGGVGGVLFVLGTVWILPALRGDALGIQQVYGHLGDGPLGVLLSPLLRPGAFFGQVFSVRIGVWVLGLVLSLGLLPLLRPGWLLPALPILALHALSSRTSQQDLAFHYHAPLVPWLLLATGWLLCRAPAWRTFSLLEAIERRFDDRARVVLLGLGWFGVLALGQWHGFQARGLTPEPLAAFADVARADDPLSPVKRALVKTVPASAPTLGSVDLLAELSTRSQLWGLPGVVRGAKDWSEVPYAPLPAEGWVVADTREGPRSFWTDVSGHRSSEALAHGAARWRGVAQAPSRGLIGAVEGVILLGPGGEALIEVLPEGEVVERPRILSCTPRPSEAPAGVLPYRVEVALPAEWRWALHLGIAYQTAKGEVVRKAHWPLFYRLYDHGDRPVHVAISVGFLAGLGTEAKVFLWPVGSGVPIHGLAIELE